MTSGASAYCEHVAIRVRDIDWHVGFFGDVFGMKPRRESAAVDGKPRQIWLVGGLQLIADADLRAGAGRLAHVGLMVDDLDAALEAARRWSVGSLPKARHWLGLPDGLEIELMEAGPGAVSAILAINPRAEP